MVKIPPANAGDLRDAGSIPGPGRFPGVGNGYPVFLLGESRGQRSLAGYSSYPHKAPDLACMHTQPSHWDFLKLFQ